MKRIKHDSSTTVENERHSDRREESFTPWPWKFSRFFPAKRGLSDSLQISRSVRNDKEPELLLRTIKLTYLLLFLAVTTWCLLIIGAPYLASRNAMVSGFIYLFFSSICHQQPDKSLFLFGKQFAVCSRCTAIYFGFLSGTLIYPLVTSLKKMYLPPKSILFAALVLIGVDIFRGFFPIWTNTLTSRIVTGFILGAVSSFYVTPGVCDFALNLKHSSDSG